MGPEVAQQREGYPPQAFRPGFQARNVVDAYAQDLGIRSGVRSLGSFERLDLVRSNRSPGHREEGQYDILPAQLAQVDLTAEVRWEGKRWGRFSDFKRHR